MANRRFRYVPDPNDKPFLTYRFKPRPPSEGERRALEIYLAGIAGWLEERRRQRESEGQTDATS